VHPEIAACVADCGARIDDEVIGVQIRT
jgi:hypothetical protein